MTAVAWLCDFDGTIAPDDIGSAFQLRFGSGHEAENDALEQRWRRGELGHRELTVQQCRLLRVREDEALAFTRGFTLDPAFAEFAGEARARGDVVAVASEGFDFYVRDQLDRAGLDTLPWSANHARFEGDRLTPEFPFADPACRECGNCKAQHVRHYRSRGYTVAVVGDGLSDRCGARAADRVFARDSLLAWCRATGLPAEPFTSFADLAVTLRS